MGRGSSEVIWWIASYPKSGNTWLRMFLSAYSHGGVVDINAPRGAEADDVLEPFYAPVSPRPLEELTDVEQVMLRPAALMRMIEAVPTDRPLLVKTHSALCSVAGFDVIPAPLTHGALYLVRDPRDVAVSYARHRSVTVDEVVGGMARTDYKIVRGRLYNYLASWSEHVRSWSEQARFPVLAVRYEDMVSHPEVVFRRVLEFLHYEVDEDLLGRALRATTLEALQAQERAGGFRERYSGETFFTSGRPGAWSEVLTGPQAERIWGDHQPMMERFNYL